MLSNLMPNVAGGTFVVQLIGVLMMLVFYGGIALLVFMVIRYLARNSKGKTQWKVTSADGMVWVADGEKKTLTAYRYNQETDQIEQVASKQLS